MDARLLLLVLVGIAALITLCHAIDGEEAVQLEGKSKQSWSNYDDVKSIEEDEAAFDDDKRTAHIFRYGRAPVFRYGKRAPSVFRYGKKATVFRYGKRSLADMDEDNDVALLVPVNGGRLASDYLPTAEEHKRKIFRYGKRSV